VDVGVGGVGGGGGFGVGDQVLGIGNEERNRVLRKKPGFKVGIPGRVEGPGSGCQWAGVRLFRSGEGRQEDGSTWGCGRFAEGPRRWKSSLPCPKIGYWRVVKVRGVVSWFVGLLVGWVVGLF